jgi:hypothetical protein
MPLAIRIGNWRSGFGGGGIIEFFNSLALSNGINGIANPLKTA